MSAQTNFGTCVAITLPTLRALLDYHAEHASEQDLSRLVDRAINEWLIRQRGPQGYSWKNVLLPDAGRAGLEAGDQVALCGGSGSAADCEACGAVTDVPRFVCREVLKWCCKVLKSAEILAGQESSPLRFFRTGEFQHLHPTGWRGLTAS